jgi:hypothetical protein
VQRVALALLALALALAGCGRGGEEASPSAETASLWVTRDRGAEVVLEAKVPAGVTVLEALKREADVETRYGGRFVHAVNGIAGSLARQADWFYFVNGIEPDLGSAEVTLRPGDVAWWDYRSWRGRMQQPVVVGAFPEPFLHGWTGGRRPVDVRHPPDLAPEARAVREVLGGEDGAGEPNVFVLAVERGAEGALLSAARGPANGSPVTFTRAAVRAAAAALARDPSIVRFRYEARFDESGRVVE